jgi:RHS repeat-associated protein
MPATQNQPFDPVLIVTALIIAFLGVCAAASTQAHETIDPYSGQLSLISTDISLPAGVLNLELRRSLLLHPQDGGLLGTRWRLNWESRLSRAGDLAVVEEDMGTLAYWQSSAGPEYTGAGGGRVVFAGDGSAMRHRADGTRDRFDGHGRLIAREYSNGNRVSLIYDGKGALVQIKAPGGQYLRLITDEAGRLGRVAASTGDSVSYEYEAGRLTRVQSGDAGFVRYTYGADGTLVRIEDPETGAVELAYDEKGRVVRRSWADDSMESYAYNDQEGITRHVDSAGGVSLIRLDAEMRREEITDPRGNTSFVAYDEVGRPVEVTGPTGGVARIRYDGNGRIVAVSDPLDRTTRFEYLGDTGLTRTVVRPDGARIDYEYDVQHNLLAIRLGDEELLNYGYTPEGLIASMRGAGIPAQAFAYHPDGQVSSVTNALGEKTRFDYDEQGNLVRETNPLGGVTQRRYDAQGRLVAQTDPAGVEFRFSYDAHGHLTGETDPAGGVIRYTHDTMGRLIRETDPAGRSTHYEYDPAGRLSRIAYPGDLAEHYGYDKAGNLASYTDTSGQTIRYDYDPAGRVSRERHANGLEIHYHYDPAGNPVTIGDSTGAKIEYTYNVTGDVEQVVDATDARTRFLYDTMRNLTALIDPEGKRKHFVYNAGGLLTGVTEATGDEVRFEYDAAGRLGTSQRPGGGITRYAYDAMGNLVSEVDPLGNEQRYSHDFAGRPINSIDAMGRISRIRYDSLGRIIEDTRPDGAAVRYEYDRTGNRTGIDDGRFPIRYGYDARGRMIRVEFPAIDRVLTSQFNPQGLRSRLLLPDGQAIGYEYDDYRQLTALVLPTGGRISFTYDLAGRQKTIHYPNGITGHYVNNGSGQITEIRHETREGEIISGSSYRLDAAWRVVERREATGERVRYAYDAAGQLVEESMAKARVRYRYGPGGNRIERRSGAATTRYRHNAADQLIQAGTETLTYDANGNLIARKGAGDWRYGYDDMNRLVEAAGPAGTRIRYGYDATGSRVWREDAEGRRWFLYDGLDLVQELDAKLQTRATYIHATGIDRPVAMLRDGKAYYYHADHLGSIRLLTDERGRVVARYDYDAFGNPVTREASVENPFTYTGREGDPATGLYYYRARYYDPGLGRFLSRDPVPPRLAMPLEQNGYLYALNNPLSFTDPLGTTTEPLGSDPGRNYNPESFKSFSTRELLALQRQYNESAQRLQSMMTRLENRPGFNYERRSARHMRLSNAYWRVNENWRVLKSLLESRAPAGPAAAQAKPGTFETGTPTKPVNQATPLKPAPGWKEWHWRAPKWNSQAAGAGALKGATSGAGAMTGVNFVACLMEGNTVSTCVTETVESLVWGAAIGAGVGVLVATGGTAGGVVATGLALWGGKATTARFWAATGGLGIFTGEPEAQQNLLATRQQLAQKHVWKITDEFPEKIAALRTRGQAVEINIATQRRAIERAYKGMETIDPAFGPLKVTNEKLSGYEKTLSACEQADAMLAAIDKTAGNALILARQSTRVLASARDKLSQCDTEEEAAEIDAQLEGGVLLAREAAKRYQAAFEEQEKVRKITEDALNLSHIVNQIRTELPGIKQSFQSEFARADSYLQDMIAAEQQAKALYSGFDGARTELRNQVKAYAGIARNIDPFELADHFTAQYARLEQQIQDIEPASSPSFKEQMSLVRRLETALKSEKLSLEKAYDLVAADIMKIVGRLSGLSACTGSHSPQSMGEAGLAIAGLGIDLAMKGPGGITGIDQIKAGLNECLVRVAQKEGGGDDDKPESPPVETKSLLQQQLGKVKEGTFGYMKIPKPTRPAGCLEYDPTNPACEPGAGAGISQQTSKQQIARALQLGEQTEPKPQSERPSGASGQPGQLIPPEYTAPGEEGEETEEREGTHIRHWPPRRPARGGVEEFVERPLIPGKAPPRKTGCNGDCGEPAVKSQEQPRVSAPQQVESGTQPAPAQPATSTGLSGYVTYRMKYVLVYKAANDATCTYTRYEDRGPLLEKDFNQYFEKRKKWVEDWKRSCQWKYENSAGPCYPFKDAQGGATKIFSFDVSLVGKDDKNKMPQHPRPSDSCG